MFIDQDRFQGMVKALEAESENQPARFRRKVLLLSIAAYVALALLLILLIVALVLFAQLAASGKNGFFMIKVGLFALLLVPIFYSVAKMVFMRLPPPEGREITREDAPRLFEILDKMKRKLNGPDIDHVIIEREFNASIVQVPRFGLMGGARNYLCLGLPFMSSVAPKEMFAVIAHEYGHLCGNHGKFGAWVYRQRRVFAALHEQVAKNADESLIHAFIAWMMKHFWPPYQAHTFVLSRQQEYEADRTASKLVGAKWIASGLVRTELLGKWISETYWPKFFKQADQSYKPSFMPFGLMREAFASNYDAWATQLALTKAWQVPSGLLDTHPCLRERCEAVGETASIPPRLDVTAADAILGAFSRQLNKEFDESWWRDAQHEWQKRHDYVMKARETIIKLGERQIEDLKLEELQELASLKVDIESPSAAKPVYAHWLGRTGGPYPKAAYAYGMILLDEKNDEGLEHLMNAARADESAVEAVAYRGYDYIFETKGEAQAKLWWEKMVAMSS
jgi:Zn-dependent protease with chaperone function